MSEICPENYREAEEILLYRDIIDELFLEEDDMSFSLKPLDGIRVHLHKGCWEFETCFRYYRYFYNDPNSNFLRRFAFDCARAFGKKEAWITDEYHGWAGVLNSLSASFEDWLNSKSKVEGVSDEVLEYVQDGFSDEDDYSTKYHDTFKGEPRKRLAQLSAQFPEYEILTIDSYANIILARKEGKLYALDTIKGKLVVDTPIDGILSNSVGVQIYKGDRSIIIGYDGVAITQYGKHDFQWDELRKRKKNFIRLSDKLTGEIWTFPED